MGRLASAAIGECVRALQQPRQNLDRVPTPAGKTPRHDRRRPDPAWSRPAETHTHLSKRDRKLLHPGPWLRSEPEIHLAKGSLAKPRQFLAKPRSQLLRHL